MGVSGNKTTASFGSHDVWLVQLAEPVAIMAQPQSQVVVAGDTAQFNVGVAGSKPFYYLWFFNGMNMSWTTNGTLTLSNGGCSDGGEYFVVVSNSVSVVTSAVAVLTVVDTVPPSLTCPGNLTFSTTSVTGNVFVSLTDGSTGWNRISRTATNGGWLLISVGVPGRIYQVQRSTNMVDWAVIATQTAPRHGVMEYVDTDPPEPAAFYRMAAP